MTVKKRKDWFRAEEKKLRRLIDELNIAEDHCRIPRKIGKKENPLEKC